MQILLTKCFLAIEHLSKQHPVTPCKVSFRLEIICCFSNSCGTSKLQQFVSPPHPHRRVHSGGITRFHCGEKKSSPVRSVSHYLLPVCQSHCSQRRIPVFPLKSEPDYSKLLVCLQHSFRPLGQPLAVTLWVPLPVIPVVGNLSYRQTTALLAWCLRLSAYPECMWVSLCRSATTEKMGDKGRVQHSNSN